MFLRKGVAGVGRPSSLLVVAILSVNVFNYSSANTSYLYTPLKSQRVYALTQ